MKPTFLLLLLPGLALSPGPKKPPRPQVITVRNRLPVARPAETVSLPAARWQALAATYGADNLLVQDDGGAVLVSQLLDNDGDGRPDELLFQAALGAGERRRFTLRGAPDGAARRPAAGPTTFSRFVPERTDDYAWENERVGFRTYGPVAEQLADRHAPDGTLSSGMDCWLKRVPYPVINKWYAGNATEPGFYHHDRGEGYDPYHVGASRGCGGTGVWAAGRLFVSKNFTSYRTLATGPIRTVFELTYAPWAADGQTVTERKRISLDLGSNLTRYEEHLSSPAPLPNRTIGLTLHQQQGSVRADSAAGWFRYWEPVDSAEIGTGVVVAPARLLRVRDYRSPRPDQSQLLIMTRPGPEPLVFYAGFGWTRSGQFRTVRDWDAYLAAFARRVASPLEVGWK